MAKFRNVKVAINCKHKDDACFILSHVDLEWINARHKNQPPSSIKVVASML